jgi:hypothetical protein
MMVVSHYAHRPRNHVLSVLGNIVPNSECYRRVLLHAADDIYSNHVEDRRLDIGPCVPSKCLQQGTSRPSCFGDVQSIPPTAAAWGCGTCGRNSFIARGIISLAKRIPATSVPTGFELKKHMWEFDILGRNIRMAHGNNWLGRLTYVTKQPELSSQSHD